MQVLEKILEEIKKPENYTIMCGKHVTTVDRVEEIIRSHMDGATDTDDTEEKIREHIAECLHRIDNIRSFVGSKKYSDDARCRKNIDVLKKSIVAMEEYLRFKKRNDNDGWIPVEERLPEANKRVLVTVKHSGWIADFYSDWVPEEKKIKHPEKSGTYIGYIHENSVWTFVDWEGQDNICDKEFGQNLGTVYDVVTHWCPLPEPYKLKKDIVTAGKEHIMSRFMTVE